MTTERQWQYRRKGTIGALLAALRASVDKLEESVNESYAQHCLTDIGGRGVQAGIGRIIAELDGMTGELVERLPDNENKPNRPRKPAAALPATPSAEALIETRKKGRTQQGLAPPSFEPETLPQTEGKKPRKRGKGK